MRAGNRRKIADSVRSVCLKRYTGICLAECLADKRNFPVFRTRFFSINGKINLSAAGISFNIDRSVRIIRKFQVFGRSCNRRIHGRFHISNDHRMVKPFVHLQLRKDHRIVKRRGNLADSAAVSLYGRSVFVRSCQFIAVFGIKRTDCFIYGELFSRIYHRTVDLRSAVLYVFRSSCGGRTVIRMERSEHVFYFGQLFFSSLRFRHFRL